MSDSNRPDPSAPPAKPTDSPRKLDLSMTQVLGGALAAMTAAALGSRLGVAGTISGAAVASVIAGVAGSLYTASLRHTRDKVATVLTSRGGHKPDSAAQQERLPVPTAGRQQRSLPWRAVLAAAVATFAVALVALTGLESLAGGALSGGRGTTIEQVTKPEKTTSKHTSDDSERDRTPTPSKPASPTAKESTSAPSAKATPTTTESPASTTTQHPETSTQHPETSTQHPETSTQHPETSVPHAPTQEKTPANAG